MTPRSIKKDHPIKPAAPRKPRAKKEATPEPLPVRVTEQTGNRERATAMQDAFKKSYAGKPGDAQAEAANVAAQEDILNEPLLSEENPELDALLEQVPAPEAEGPLDLALALLGGATEIVTEGSSTSPHVTLRDGRPAPDPVEGRRERCIAPGRPAPKAPTTDRLKLLAAAEKAQQEDRDSRAEGRAAEAANTELQAEDPSFGGRCAPDNAPLIDNLLLENMAAMDLGLAPKTFHQVAVILVPPGTSLSISVNGSLTITAGSVQLDR